MLEVLKYPDERLKQAAVPVTEFGTDLHQLLDAMAETMYSANGIGLAAPQVGRPIRAFVIDLGMEQKEHQRIYEIINPVLSAGTGKIVFEEGCLSVPGVSEEVTRKSRIQVDYHDRNGQPKSLIAEDLLAVALQHENDHLDGILFLERLSPLKRRFVKRKLEKVMTL